LVSSLVIFVFFSPLWWSWLLELYYWRVWVGWRCAEGFDCLERNWDYWTCWYAYTCLCIFADCSECCRYYGFLIPVSVCRRYYYMCWIEENKNKQSKANRSNRNCKQ
jgi:hypothetical protein